MSERWIDRIPWITAILCAFLLGVGVGNEATRKVLRDAHPSCFATEYWKKFDAAMGEAFELQIALMKLAAKKLEDAASGQVSEGSTGAAKRGDAP